jgi:uncharacterized membrane protein YdjX (TVP38/TMEM64 family)
MTRSRALLVTAVVGGGAAVAGAVWWSGLVSLDAEALAARLRAAGPIGPIALFALLVLQCVVAPIPSEPLMMAAGYVYGSTAGFAIAWIGVVVGALACFGLARLFGRPLALRFVKSHHLDTLDSYVAERGVGSTFAVLLAIRVLAFASFDVVSYGCGLTRFPVGWFLLATVLGVVPKAFTFTYAGASVASRPGWLDAVILVGSLGFLVLVPWLARRRRQANAVPETPAP